MLRKRNKFIIYYKVEFRKLKKCIDRDMIL